MDESTGTEVSTEESGSALRAKYEAEMKARQDAERVNHELASTVVILQGSHDLVKASDLAGVQADQLAAKAAELQTQRVKERDDFFAAEAARRGIRLDAPSETPSALPEGMSRVASLGSLGGTPPSQVKPTLETADDYLNAAFSALK